MTDSAPVLDLTDTPCAACGEVSVENERMIGCDGCLQWFHTRCVGITSDVEKEKRWFCTDDKCQQAMKKKKSRSKKNDDSDRSSVKSDAALSFEQKLRAMEQSQKRMEQELEAEMALKRKENEFKRAMERKRMLMEKQIREEEEEQDNLLQEEILRERSLQLERMKARQQSFEDNLKSLDNEIAKLKSSGGKNKVQKDVAGEGGSGVNRTPLRNPEVGRLTEENLKKMKAQLGPSVGEHSDDDDDDDSDTNEESEDGDSDQTDEYDNKSMRKGKGKMPSGSSSQNGLGQPQRGPTKTQLAARNGISRKLPTFSGKPEEWPLFYGAYQASNAACGYTDVENLVRLQECLKDSALEMVRGQLLLPKSVPKVIAKLRQ